MIIDEPIIKSILDNDLYTFTVGQVAFNHFPNVKVKYRFINRGKTKFPYGFYAELLVQLEHMRNLALNDVEYAWLETLGYFSFEYLQFLKNYRFNPDELTITMHDGNLDVEFEGTWVGLIMWEVPFLALVSELYYKINGLKKDSLWKDRIAAKARLLSHNGSQWMEFGTRRRFDFESQNAVVAIQKEYKGFLGTSNMLLAMIHKVLANGTMSHQGPMAMQAIFGIKYANKAWRWYWTLTHGGKLNTFLPDTFTTKVFFQDFDKEEARRWNLRQDSGDPYSWMDMVIEHYAKLGVPTQDRKFVFSDSLDPEKFNALTNKYREVGTIIGGIGTNLSNDCGHSPLSIVIKLSAVNIGDKWIEVVKLSDTNGKYTGLPDAILQAKQTLNIS